MTDVKISGASYHIHRQAWRVGFRHLNKDLYLGCFRDPSIAAWVADFSRYLVFGMKPANWHPRVGRPNDKPHLRDDFPRVLILRKIADSGVLTREKLSERLASFDAACKR